MRFLRKSKSLPDISASNPASRAELVRNLVDRRDPKALAATSTAIALSIGFPFNDIRGTSDGGGAAWGMDAVGRAAYVAVRMAVEITKESSDVCPPLKALCVMKGIKRRVVI